MCARVTCSHGTVYNVYMCDLCSHSTTYDMYMCDCNHGTTYNVYMCDLCSHGTVYVYMCDLCSHGTVSNVCMCDLCSHGTVYNVCMCDCNHGTTYNVHQTRICFWKWERLLTSCGRSLGRVDSETWGSEVQSLSPLWWFCQLGIWPWPCSPALAQDKPSQVKPEWWTQPLLGTHSCRGRKRLKQAGIRPCSLTWLALEMGVPSGGLDSVGLARSGKQHRPWLTWYLFVLPV